MAIYEHMVVSDKVRGQIIARVPSTAIRTDLIKDGFVGLREDGIAKAVMGLTTVEEVLRVSQAVDA
jgi:type II secretory ATPase GspE/PulE/Tfp pilus assembly ATPase PilB-like protein